MRRFWMVGMGGAALLATWMVTDVARAGGDQAEKEVRRPGRRVEIMRMFGGGRLGVSLEDVGADDVGRLGLSAERGAVVTDVQEGSAAEKAGLEDGDVIVRFGGQDVWSAAQLARLVRETPAGRTVALEVSRGGAIQKLSVALAKPDRDRMFGVGPGGMGEDFHFEMPDFEMPDLSDLPELADLPTPPVPPVPPVPPMPPAFHFGPGQGRKLGLSYQELGDQLARYFKVEGGVLVIDVEEDGPAAKAGIRAGDVIVRVEGKAVKDGGDLREALRDAAGGTNATIGLQREGRSMDLTVKLGEAQSAPAARARRRGART
jgi:serine protease Do